jgi:hypothetical protein
LNIEVDYLYVSHRAHQLFKRILITFTVYIAYPICNVYQIIFVKLRKQSWSSIYGEFALSMMHLFITVVVLYRYMTKQRYIKAADDRYTDSEIMLTVYYRESFLDMTLVFGLYMMIQWARMLIVLRVNSFIGSMIRIIENMLFEIIKFLIIYLLILVVFTSSAHLFFMRVSGYSTMTDSFITLFSASLGSFDFTPFRSKEMVLSTSFGYYFLILYLIITNIVLLNFIIAILTNTYNKYYSSLISLSIPLNAILIPESPSIIFCKSKRLNNIIIHISYLPVMIIGTLLF